VALKRMLFGRLLSALLIIERLVVVFVEWVRVYHPLLRRIDHDRDGFGDR
jgi:hypothetical protein